MSAQSVLDDPAALAAGDPGGMLAAVASSGRQLRAGEGALEGVDGLPTRRPRVLVVAGMGGSGAAGDVVSAVAGPDAPVPVLVHRGYGLPGWVGPEDLVAGVSCSGHTEETLSAVARAVERGIPLVTVGAPDSPLAGIAKDAAAAHVPVEAAGRQPRACLWSLAAPLVVLGHELGVLEAGAPARAAAAEILDRVAADADPGAPFATNPAKRLAAELIGTLPMLWGFSALAGVAARRFAAQLAENAKLPAVAGTMSEPHHNQVATFDGPFAGDVGIRLHPVLLRDPAEPARLTRRAEESAALAAAAGLAVSELRAVDGHPLVRLASLVGLVDFATVYLALAQGIDPTPVRPIEELKVRLAR